MKYVNSHRNIFSEGLCSFTDGYLTHGEKIKINLGEVTGGKLCISYEFKRSNNSISGTYVFIVREAGGSVCFSNYSKGTPTITLEDISDNTIKAYSINNKDWYKIYEIYDYEAGTVDMYVNGVYFYRTTNARISTPSFIELRLPVYSSDESKFIGIRNIIVSDEEFSIDDTVKELPLETVLSEWQEDETVYFTENTDKRMILKAKKSLGYNISSFGLYLEGIQSGEISSIEVDGTRYDVDGKSYIYVPVNTYSDIEIKAVE